MEKFAILILMFLATTHSAKNKKTKLENVEPEDETMKMIKTLWDAPQQQQQQQYLFSSCSQVECYEFCENVNSKITDQEWERPFIAAFIKLLEFYNPHHHAKVKGQEKEHQLIDKFLDEFVITEPGYRLFFMLDIPEPVVDVRTEEQIQEDIEDDAYNIQKYKDCMKDIINDIDYTKNAEVGQEVYWWDKFTEHIDYAKNELYKKLNVAEDMSQEHKLIRSQIRKYKIFLKDLWFGNTEHTHRALIGFRHVFVGEEVKKFKSMTGLHNWYQFQRLLCIKIDITKGYKKNEKHRNGKYNFRFYTPLVEPVGFEQKDNNVKLCEIEFEWEGKAKQQPSSILFGSQPEVEFAAFTLCFNEIEHEKAGTKWTSAKCNTHLGAKIVVVRDKDAEGLARKGSSKLKTVFFAKS